MHVCIILTALVLSRYAGRECFRRMVEMTSREHKRISL